MENHQMSRGTSFVVGLALITGANILLFAHGQPKEKPPTVPEEQQKEKRPAPEGQPKEKPPAEPETPIGAKWWPSEWGPDDQRGAANRLTPQKVLEAKELITTGKI